MAIWHIIFEVLDAMVNIVDQGQAMHPTCSTDCTGSSFYTSSLINLKHTFVSR